MSDEEQLFDDFGEDQPAAQDDLFGDADGDFEEELEPELQEVQDEEPEQPAAAPSNTGGTLDRKTMKATLLALAKKRTHGADESGSKKKKQRKDKDRDKSGGSSSRPQRLKRQRASSPEHGASAGSRGGQQYDELPEEQLAQETAADLDFIDDDGVPEDERYEEDVEALAAAEEAEEAVPGEEEEGEPANIVEEVLQRRKRAKRKESESEVDAEVMSLVGMMQACAESDDAALKSQPPRPALEKLKQLAEVGRVLRQRKYHETFLASKGLNAMASWLRPYQNGTLPNAKIRAELVSLLGVLQLDTTNDYIRERLEESELGKIVMFYYKNPNESMPLRSQCRDLIHAWSAPIFADNDEEQRKRRQRERAHRQRQTAEKADREWKERRELEEAERRRKLGPAEAGFRARAAVPQPSKMDFVINPGSRMDPLEASLRGDGVGGQGGGGGGSSGAKKPQQSPIGGRLGKVLQQRKRGSKDRFGGMSVEGRGIQL